MPKAVLLTIVVPRLSLRKRPCQGPCLPHCYQKSKPGSQRRQNRKTPKRRRSQSQKTRTKSSRRKTGKPMRSKRAAQL